MSDNEEDELLSVVIIKVNIFIIQKYDFLIIQNGKKAVVGTQEGILTIWSWGDWGDMNDRYPGHPHSIDTMVALDEDTICTGSSDGLIR